MLASHDPSGIDLRPSQLSRDIDADDLQSADISLPAFEVRPRRFFPPEENWRGTRPSYAAKSRPHRKLSTDGANASTAMAVNEPTPGIVCRGRAVSAMSGRFVAARAVYVCADESVMLNKGPYLSEAIADLDLFWTV